MHPHTPGRLCLGNYHRPAPASANRGAGVNSSPWHAAGVPLFQVHGGVIDFEHDFARKGCNLEHSLGARGWRHDPDQAARALSFQVESDSALKPLILSMILSEKSATFRDHALATRWHRPIISESLYGGCWGEVAERSKAAHLGAYTGNRIGGSNPSPLRPTPCIAWFPDVPFLQQPQ